MADALITHLGGVDAALTFADRQMRAAESAALATWTMLVAHLQRSRDRQ